MRIASYSRLAFGMVLAAGLAVGAVAVGWLWLQILSDLGRLRSAPLDNVSWGWPSLKSNC